MKKSRKHIALSLLLALLILAVQTAFFPLHYYSTHHASTHVQTQNEKDRPYELKQTAHTPVSSLADESCYWCDLFAHQGYFLEKSSDFIFQRSDLTLTQPLSCIYFSLKAELPDSRGPPSVSIL